MTDEKKRFTAFKVSIGVLNQSKINFDEERFTSVTLSDSKEVVRVNIIATVIDKFMSDQKNYASITIDDGTGNIRVKAFSDTLDMIKEIVPGDTVLIIGLLKYYNNELYILPEIIKNIDPRWLLVRKLELQKKYKTYQIDTKENEKNLTKNQFIKYDNKFTQNSQLENYFATEEKIEEEKEINENKLEKIEGILINQEPSLRDQIVEILRNADAGEGVDIEKLIMSLKAPVDEINSMLITLLEEGAIFEPRPGRLKLL